jgi:hypothetical protein
MLKKPESTVPAEGSSPALPVCPSVMAALATQHEDQRMVCALVAAAMGARGVLAVALDDVSALNGDVVAELLRSSKC